LRCGEWLALSRTESISGSGLFLVHCVDWLVTRLLDASVQSIGVEKLALVRVGVGVISSIEYSIDFGSRLSSRNLVIDTRIVIS